MKKLLVILIIQLFAFAAFAQKPSKEQMEADKKRLAEAMQKLNEQTSKMSPAAKKGYDSMLNQYGMGQKIDNAVKQLNSSQTTKSGSFSYGLVPAKNAKAIASIAATPTVSAMGGFINTTGNNTFAAVLPAAKNKANEIFKALKEKGATIDETGNAAAVLWMNGRTQIALTLMAQVCAADPSNTDNLNNYASMLTMMGAPEMAIPILNNLNGRFKKNSTILNNLGQAWFALGDVDKADKYLDSTLLIAAAHPQANETKCLIDESKGNKTTAIAHAKAAFKQGSTTVRRDRLQQLGYVPGAGDYNNFPPNNASDDLLNLGGFAMPSFPLSVEECKALEPVWKQFRSDIDKRLKSLQKITDESNKMMTNRLQDQQKQFMNAMNKTLSNPGSVSQSSAVQIAGAPLFSEKMNARENIVLQNLQQKKQAAAQKIAAFANGEGSALKKKYQDAMQQVNEKWKQVGEGGTANIEVICMESVKAANDFLKPYNTRLESLYNDYLSAEKQLLNEMSYSSLYTTYPELLPGINAGLQAQWLRDVSLTQNGFNFESVTKYECIEPAGGKSGRLTQFKDLNCNINSEFNVGLSGMGFSMKLNCSGMTSSFNAGAIGISLSQDLDHAGFGDSFKNCTVSIGPKASVGGKIGPLEASISAGAGADIEIDRNGISDVVLKAGVEAEAGAGPLKGSAGAEGRMSLNSGAGSVQGTGMFGK